MTDELEFDLLITARDRPHGLVDEVATRHPRDEVAAGVADLVADGFLTAGTGGAVSGISDRGLALLADLESVD